MFNISMYNGKKIKILITKRSMSMKKSIQNFDDDEKLTHKKLMFNIRKIDKKHRCYNYKKIDVDGKSIENIDA